MNQAPIDPNAELRAADDAVKAGRFADAAARLANLLPQFPAHPAVVAVLDALVAAAPDPLALAPTKPPFTYGSAAIRAYALGKAGRAAEAFPLFRELVTAAVGNGIIDWAVPWLDAGQIGAAERTLLVTLFLASTQQRWGNPRTLAPEQAAVVNRWLPHLRAEMAARPVEDMCFPLYIPLLRKAGAMDEAVEVSRARHAAVNDYASAVNLAGTYREAKRFDEWRAACDEVFRHAPDDVFTRLDLGDCYWEEQDNLAEAERWYADALRVQPDNDWAKPSLLAVRHLRTEDLQWLEQLEDYHAANPGNRRAFICVGRLTPFFANFLDPRDATSNNMRSVAEQVAQAPPGEVTGTVKCATTGLEVPSCRRAIDRQLERWGGKITVTREVRGMQTPDPREPRVPVRHRLWRYDGVNPVPAVEPPPAEVAHWVGQIAATHYDAFGWHGYAEQVVGHLGPGCVPGMLAVMAHPPAAPDGWLEWDWAVRVHFAAALVIGATSRDWDGSARREVLFDLANGPLDWSTAAAVVALTWTARQEDAPEIARDVRRLLWDVYRGLPRPGADWYEVVILNCRLRLPELTAQERDETRAARREVARRRARPTSDAEMMARLFLARPRPAGIDEGDLARLAIEAFTLPGGRAHSGFLSVLATGLGATRRQLDTAEGELKEYLTEQLRVLEVIVAETAKDSPAPNPNDAADGEDVP